MSSHTAFFYGTLMAPQILHRVIWGTPFPPTPAHAALLRIRPAILHAHRRHKVRYADYPAILPSTTTSSVRGTLVEGLTDGDMWRLGIFEGEQYKRKKVRVRVLEQEDVTGSSSQPGDGHVEGEEVEAEVYVWCSSPDELESEEWDFAEFVRDKMKWWVGKDAAEADEGFQDVDDAVAAASKAEKEVLESAV